MINAERVSNTSLRLKEIMKERNLKQVDIIKMAQPYCHKFGEKLNRSNLSQYVNGDFEPGQHKTFILACALDVSEAWLMGYNVPMERQNDGGGILGGELKQLIHNISLEIDVDYDALVELYLNRSFPRDLNYNGLIYFFAHYLGLSLYVSKDNTLSYKQKIITNEIKSLCENDLDRVYSYIEKIKEIRCMENVSPSIQRTSDSTD